MLRVRLDWVAAQQHSMRRADSHRNITQLTKKKKDPQDIEVIVSVSIFDKEEFLRFCDALQVETKELGIVSLGATMLGSQRYFIDEIAKGLADGIHYFIVLKGRQLGITTICLALDLYWHFKHPGTQGTLATDTEENREMFRSTLTMYMDSLPMKWRQPVTSHNRTQIVLGNRSRMVYQVAGTRKNVGFGAGKALSFMHATETGKWGEGTDLSSLEASLAQTNPKRFYVFESTAYGFNMFNEMWETAVSATTQRAIFIGWWRNDMYRVRETDLDDVRREIFKVYWDGVLTTAEQKWVDQVKELYDYDIHKEQIAWWRWTLNETMKGDEDQMYEKYPPTAEYAFIMTGSQFFSPQRLTDVMKLLKDKPCTLHRFVFGAAFEDTQLIDCNEKTATLTIWETPVPRGQYVIGCDPAWGSSEWADRFCINVSRVWADGIEQVAEFCTPDINTMQFAWVMLYLAGAYGDINLGSNVMINLEINGPGAAVWNEIQALKQRAAMSPGGANVARILMNIQNYLYKRPDSLGAGYAYHTKTTQGEKERFLGLMKDNHEMGILVINSTELLMEMKNVVRDGGVIGAPGRGKDDRVIAQALSVIAWVDFIRVRLMQARITRASQAQQAAMPEAYANVNRGVSNWLQHIGLRDKLPLPRPPPANQRVH